MPDDCVELWKRPEEDLDPKQLEEICRTDFMYYRWARILARRSVLHTQGKT